MDDDGDIIILTTCFCFPTISSFTWNCLAGIILEEIIAMNS